MALSVHHKGVMVPNYDNEPEYVDSAFLPSPNANASEPLS